MYYINVRKTLKNCKNSNNRICATSLKTLKDRYRYVTFPNEIIERQNLQILRETYKKLKEWSGANLYGAVGWECS